MTSQSAAEGGNGGGPDPAGEPPYFDTSIAHPARVYDYWLGGKDNYEADRDAAEQVIAANPNVLPGVQANRAFLRRAVEYLAGEAGIRQFLDIDRPTRGIPTRSCEEAAGILDFSQPVAVMFLMVLQYVPDSDSPHQVVSRLIDAVPPGSYLVISDTSRDIDTERVATTASPDLVRGGTAATLSRGRDDSVPGPW